MKTLTYLPVNWVNGLKLTSKHFFANQYSQTEALNREAGRSLTSYNYGLGEVLEGIGDNLEIEISGDTMSTLCVRLKSCNAITKGGLPIVYYDGLYGDEKPCATISESGLQAEDSEYMVLISVDPYHLIPVGEPDPEEVPLHHPYVLPSIKLHIVPKNQVNKSFYSQNFLLVAEVCRQGNTYKINHQYIPPVQHSACHDGIKTFISQLARTLQSIKEDVKLIYSRNVADKRRDTLANNTFELCKAFSAFYNSRIFFIEQIALEQPPISLTTRSGCTITLDDEKGSVMMKDKEGNSYTADGEGNITISASKSITLCVGENKIMIDSEGNISSNAEKDITESAGANIAQSAENIDCTASSNYNISSTDFTASGSSSATVSGTTKATIDSSGTTAVAGTIVKLN